MKTPRPSPTHHVHRPKARVPCLSLLCLFAIAAPLLPAQRARIHTRAVQALADTATAINSGPLPSSQPLTLNLRLQPTAAQVAALDQLLAEQADAASPGYRHWLTSDQFATRFGASAEQLAAVTSYLGLHGLAVSSISPSHTSLTVTGTAGQAQIAFAISLDRFYSGTTPFFANTTDPTLPHDIAALVAGISGLDNLPQPASARIAISPVADRSPAVNARITSTDGSLPEAVPPDALTLLAEAIDANASPVLTLTTAACSSDLTQADVDAYRALLRQASAQGITVLATSSCASATSSSFPASLAEVTALTTSAHESATAPSGMEARPRWQAAPGLPPDGLRHEPDLTTASAAAFAQAIAILNQQTGNRLGNVNATLYALAKVPGLYTQPDAVPNTPPTGNWEPATGLGLIDLQTLLKVYPRTSGISTKTSLISSSYAVNYGNPFTLTSNVQVTGIIPPVTPTTPYPPAPSGIVTFTASTQGILGTSGIDGSGSATLDSGVLPVGTYTLTAMYSGDAFYASSSSTSNVTITVSLVNAKLLATLSPTTNIPYGAAATVTATVTLPGSAAAPTGPVSAQISSGASVSATLSPNPGSNSATANIAVSVPPPGTYNVQVTCQGSTNFQCQTPVNIPITTVKGYTNTTVSVTPSAPEAGQPISLTATVVNSGNGTGVYTYGGSISFYDSGKLVATAPVATNQATTTTALSGTRAHNLTAVYSGDPNWNTSNSGAVAVLPTILPDTLTLTSNVSSLTSLAGVNIVFTGSITATVVYRSGPTGTLTFFDTFNNSVIQLGNPSPLIANGPYASIGLFTTTGLQPGVHRIYAQYSGDDSYAPAISPVMTLSLSDFNLSMTPVNLTLAQGKSAQVSAILGSSGGFAGTVSLGCTPPGSSEATCTISPSSLAIGQTATVTISTSAPRSVSPGQQANRLGGWTSMTGISLAALFLFFAPRRRRSLPSLLLVMLAVTLTANLGCGLGTSVATAPVSGTGATPSDPGTPLGTQNYIITAAASDGVNSVRHTYQYQVTVQ